MIVAARGLEEATSQLLQHEGGHSLVEKKDFEGKMAIDYCCGPTTRLSLFTLVLIKMKDLNIVPILSTALVEASKNGNSDIVRYLLDHEMGDDSDFVNAPNILSDKKRPLIAAAEAGNLEILKMLLDKGASTEMVDSNNFTALMLASANGHSECCEALLTRNADVHATSQFGFTALILAAGNGHKATAELLVAKGANVNARNGWGRTALADACVHGHGELYDVLTIAGSDTTVTDEMTDSIVDVRNFLSYKDRVRLGLLGEAPPLNRGPGSENNLSKQNTSSSTCSLS